MYVVEYYLAMRKESLPFVATWMELEAIMKSVRDLYMKSKRAELLEAENG